jgi:hypothetical protein
MNIKSLTLKKINSQGNTRENKPTNPKPDLYYLLNEKRYHLLVIK